MLDLAHFNAKLLHFVLSAIICSEEILIKFIGKMRNDQELKKWKMDVYTTFFCGCLLTVGGLIVLVASVYISFTIIHGASVLTEVVLSGCVVMLGVHLMLRSLPKLIDMATTKKDCETPFYYELEPIAQRRGLPPVPRDIGREYDPVVVDRV